MFLVCNVPEYLNMALHFSTPVLAAVWSRVTCHVSRLTAAWQRGKLNET